MERLQVPALHCQKPLLTVFPNEKMHVFPLTWGSNLQIQNLSLLSQHPHMMTLSVQPLSVPHVYRRDKLYQDYMCDFYAHPSQGYDKENLPIILSKGTQALFIIILPSSSSKYCNFKRDDAITFSSRKITSPFAHCLCVLFDESMLKLTCSLAVLCC